MGWYQTKNLAHQGDQLVKWRDNIENEEKKLPSIPKTGDQYLENVKNSVKLDHQK